MLVGFLDDSSFRWHPERAAMLDRAQGVGARVIRAFIRWHLAAPERPQPGAPPFDEPRLWELDELVAGANARGMEVMFTIWGTPPWANDGQAPNRAPTDLDALRDFAHGLAARYPSVRRYAIWNEPNTALFLSPQFDEEGNSVAPQAYAALYRAAHEGIKAASPGALVAIGETSSHGRDAPSPGTAQDSHSPVRFARLLAEISPRLEFDAWAHHPYPVDPASPPERGSRWPAVTMTSLERFAETLDELFGRDGIPLWLSEFAYETSPAEARGVSHELQAAYAERALKLAAANPRVELFVWFTFRDHESNARQSGLIDAGGEERPSYRRFASAVSGLNEGRGLQD
jgi:polysaccharide biosynthesis protein PslG